MYIYNTILCILTKASTYRKPVNTAVRVCKTAEGMTSLTFTSFSPLANAINFSIFFSPILESHRNTMHFLSKLEANVNAKIMFV